MRGWTNSWTDQADVCASLRLGASLYPKSMSRSRRPCPSARPRPKRRVTRPRSVNFTTSEIWLVDATDSGLEDEEEEDDEEEETEFPSETRFLLRLGMLLSLAGGRKGC